MSISTSFRNLSVMLPALLVGVVCVAAQEAPTASTQLSDPVPSGMYERFTVIQKIRLGATTLVNPSAAESVAVVYSYEPREVLTASGWPKEISDKISAGQVQFGQMVGSGVNTVLRVDQKTTKDVANTIQQREIGDSNYSHKGKLLSVHPSLAGAKPSGEWIAWSPEDQKK